MMRGFEARSEFETRLSLSKREPANNDFTRSSGSDDVKAKDMRQISRKAGDTGQVMLLCRYAIQECYDSSNLNGVEC
jgi:hypothetical protein